MIEGPSAAAAEDGELVAVFIDGAVAVDSFGNCERFPAYLARGDELRHWLRAESVEVGLGLGAEEFDDPHAVLAVGDEGELLRADHADLDVPDIVERSASIEHLHQLRMLGLFDIHDGNAVLSSGDIGVGPSDVDISSIVDGQLRLRDGLRTVKMSHIEDFEAPAVDDEGVAELNGDSLRIVEDGRADLGNDLRMQRIGERDDFETATAENIGVS